jgi:hypothetical protein
MGAIRTLAAVAAVLLASATLVACTGTPDPAPVASDYSTTSPSSSAEPKPEPDPELVPAGDAEENSAYFDFVNSSFLADGNPGGQPIIDNLVSAGFDKTAMQVTPDRTPRGTEVDSLQFSVRMGEGCLVGQVDDSGYTSTVVPALGSGSCLVGNTRAIDW